MTDGNHSMDNNMDSGIPHSNIVKGSIILTPTNYVGRVMWVQEPDFVEGCPKVSVEYLELHGAYNVFNMTDLTLIADGADTPKYDVISEQKLSYEREKYLAEQEKVNAYVKSGKVKKLKEVDPLTKALGSLNQDQLEKILKILGD